MAQGALKRSFKKAQKSMKLALLQFSKEEKDPEQPREPLVEFAAALATQFGGTIALEIFATESTLH